MITIKILVKTSIKLVCAVIISAGAAVYTIVPERILESVKKSKPVSESQIEDAVSRSLIKSHSSSPTSSGSQTS